MSITINWDVPFEAKPAGTRNLNLGAPDIRGFKTAVQERLVREHNWDLAGTQSEHGWHKLGSALCYYGTSAPTNRPDEATALSTADAGRMFWDSATNLLQIYSGSAWVDLDIIASSALTVTDDLTVGGEINNLLSSNRYIHADAPTQASIFDKLSPFLPDIDDVIKITGGYSSFGTLSGGNVNTVNLSHAIRTSSTVITFYGYFYRWRAQATTTRDGHEQGLVEFIITDGSGTLTDYDISIAW